MLPEYTRTLETYEVAYNSWVAPVLAALDAKLKGPRMRQLLTCAQRRPSAAPGGKGILVGPRAIRASPRKCAILQAYWDILHVADPLTTPLTTPVCGNSTNPDDAVLGVHALFITQKDALDKAHATLRTSIKFIKEAVVVE